MFTHKDLIPIAYQWVLKRGICGVAFKELNTHACNSEYPDVLGFGSYGHSVLIEVKVSRSDFLCDKKKKFRMYPEQGMGRYRFYMCPAGLIKPEELPNNWGLIYVAITGKAKCMVNPYCRSTTGNIWSNGFENRNMLAEHGFMFSALRRLHIKGHIESIYDKQYIYNHKE
jgi:hypothetical protein